MKELKFETIGHSLQRAKVPGGWLVRQYEDVMHNTESRGMVNGHDWRVALTFIPDPEHLWLKDESTDVPFDEDDFCPSA